MKYASCLNYKAFLKAKLQEAKKKNPGFSLRAFAKQLGLSPSRLSEILAGGNLSLKSGSKMAQNMSLAEDDRDYFLDLIKVSTRGDDLESEAARLRIDSYRERKNAFSLSLEHFKMISDWHHFALLELLSIKKQWALTELSQTLELPEEKITQILHRLRALNYIEIEGNNLIPKIQDTTTFPKVSSKAIQNYHKSIMLKAHKAIETEDPLFRDFNALIMAINRDDLGEIKTKVRKFLEEMLFYNKKPGINALYCLNLQLFPMGPNAQKKTKREDSHE